MEFGINARLRKRLDAAGQRAQAPFHRFERRGWRGADDRALEVAHQRLDGRDEILHEAAVARFGEATGEIVHGRLDVLHRLAGRERREAARDVRDVGAQRFEILDVRSARGAALQVCQLIGELRQLALQDGLAGVVGAAAASARAAEFELALALGDVVDGVLDREPPGRPRASVLAPCTLFARGLVAFARARLARAVGRHVVERAVCAPPDHVVGIAQRRAPAGRRLRAGAVGAARSDAGLTPVRQAPRHGVGALVVVEVVHMRANVRGVQTPCFIEPFGKRQPRTSRRIQRGVARVCVVLFVTEGSRSAHRALAGERPRS